MPPDKFAQILAEAGRRYNNALMCPENNSYGYAVIMKLAEMDYRNLYFANEKDRYSYMYGAKDIGKIGFQTNVKTRSQILTKLEEVLRTKHIIIKSARLYSELKTFIWKNGKAQAQKGQNDDLIMALAIGVWLYDTTPHLSKIGTDLNKSMLAAFGTSSTSIDDTVAGPEKYQMVDVTGNKRIASNKNSIYTNFDWLVK